MGVTSVDGLVSGLDTTTIINQLMSIERQPVDNLTSRKATYDAQASAWDQIGTKISSLRTAVEALDTASDLSGLSATSSNTGLATASATTAAPPGQVTFTVDRLATAHQLVSTTLPSTVGAGTFWAASGLAGIGATLSVDDGYTAGPHTLVVRDAATGGGKEAVLDGTAVAITADGNGQSATFTTADGKNLKVSFAGNVTNGTATLSVANLTSGAAATDLASAISVAGGPARAQVVSLNSSDFRLVVTANGVGSANALQWNWSGASLGLAGPSDLSTLDAQVTIPGIGTATRQSNTITDLVPGLTLNLVKADPTTPVTVDVAHDVDGTVTKVKALVDALNGVVGSLQSNSNYDPAAQKAGPLLGSSTLNSLGSSLADATGTLLTSGTYKLFSQLGVSIQKDGTYTLDESKLRGALTTDYGSATTAISALAQPLHTWAIDNDALTGTVHFAEDGAKSTSTDLQNQIDDYNVRLAATEARYRLQFTNLETALGQLKDQSTWLSGQLASLPTH